MSHPVMSRFSLFTLSVLVAVIAASAAWAAPLKEIRINGTQRVEPSTVLSYLNLQTGTDLNDDTMNEGLKNLFATGLFADVKMKQQGGVLIVDVLENPIINEIAFEGNDRIEDEELMAEIGL